MFLKAKFFVALAGCPDNTGRMGSAPFYVGIYLGLEIYELVDDKNVGLYILELQNSSKL